MLRMDAPKNTAAVPPIKTERRKKSECMVILCVLSIYEYYINVKDIHQRDPGMISLLFFCFLQMVWIPRKLKSNFHDLLVHLSEYPYSVWNHTNTLTHYLKKWCLSKKLLKIKYIYITSLMWHLHKKKLSSFS